MFSTLYGAIEHNMAPLSTAWRKRAFWKQPKNNGGMARNDRPINLEEDCWIGKNSKIEKKFNISTNHLHYNKTAVNALMSSNHFKLTILRNPESQFVSSFKVSKFSTKTRNFWPKILTKFWQRGWKIFENLIDLFSIITIYSRNWQLSWIHDPNIIKWDVEHLIYDTRRVSFHFSSLAPPAWIFVTFTVTHESLLKKISLLK